MNLKKTVENWGLPEHFKGKDYKLNFNERILEIKDRNGKLKFEMNFSYSGNVSRAFAMSQNREELDLVYIHVIEDEDRKKGVASFYLSKLIGLCKENNITTIRIGVAKNPEKSININTENCLTHDELINFYNKHLGKYFTLKIS